MSQIEELLKGEKVEWKKLGEVCEIANNLRKPIKASLRKSGEIPYYGANNIQDYVEGYTHNGEFILIAEDGSSNLEYYSIQYVNEKFWANNHVHIVKGKEKLNNRFLFHYLKTVKFAPYLTGGTRAKLTKSQLIEIELPIPSLETQEKIVKILDKFTKYVTELQAKLQAELQARIKQYDYYRDMMLSEDYLNKLSEKIDNIENYLEYIFLENIIKIKNGKDWKNLEVGDIPVYGSGGEMGVFVNKYSYNKPTVLIPRKGSIENVFYLDKPFWNVDTIFYTEINEDKIIPKYFYYFIQNYDLTKFSTNSTRPSLTQSSLNKLLIPVPPLKIQSQVVKILDKFQELINETKGLLPEEIEQRQKQYEFYREKLLTFDVKYATTGNGQ